MNKSLRLWIAAIFLLLSNVQSIQAQQIFRDSLDNALDHPHKITQTSTGYGISNPALYVFVQ